MNYQEESIKLHFKHKGKLATVSKVSVKDKEDLSLAYSPGVAGPCLEIQKDKSKVMDLTWRGNLVAVISDGTAVLGLGDIGPEAALPVMEGKCLLLKEFAGVDAIPIVLNTKDTEEIIQTIKMIAPSFSGINLEDISAPRCFEIETRLQQELDIPVFHDDQHGTAIVCLAALINSSKIIGKDLRKERVVINGAGAAAIASAKLLLEYGFNDIVVLDSKGILSSDRTDLNDFKKDLLKTVNKKDIKGGLSEAMKDAQIFIGLSVGNIVTEEMVKSMQPDPIIIAMANPTPEIDPSLAKKAGARIIATGRSDYPNQVNNVLGFPGIFRGLLDKKKKEVTMQMKLDVAKALADLVEEPNEEYIIPRPFDKKVVPAVSGAI
ncbi:NADP-dependent malic enzyme [Candidatus Dojkabacteria bacterium]|uniref:NADP-dependent malic enzyme n=1 Tax=Candidatus Dojkabacteria bacterium TaxID=2099670 RepID=A0A955LAJ4_9BACT|nr:NADP-dependent malic enzyme [Candidatus Dojkabacteria bacterium]